MKRRIAGVIALSLSLSVPVLAADLAQVDRGIAREPEYRQKAWYALLVFGPEAKSRVWMVLARSFNESLTAGGVFYGDVYLDRNADGDLTGTDERMEFNSLGDGELKDRTAQYGSINERGMTHEIGQLRQINAGRLDEPPTFLMMLRIDGKYTQRAEIEMADAPAKASIYHFDGPLSMLAYAGSQELRAGEKTGVAVASIGTPGHGPGQPMVTVFSADFPKDLHPVAEVTFAAVPNGRPPVAVRARLDDRC